LGGVFFPFLIAESKGLLGRYGTAMVEMLSGMYAALLSILQLPEVAYKKALEREEGAQFLEPTSITRRVIGLLAYASSWSFWALSADGELAGCAARPTEGYVRECLFQGYTTPY
jgi:hypothetical protein